MITDRIGLHSVLLPLLFDDRKQYEFLASTEYLHAPVKKQKREEKTKQNKNQKGNCSNFLLVK